MAVSGKRSKTSNNVLLSKLSPSQQKKIKKPLLSKRSSNPQYALKLAIMHEEMMQTGMIDERDEVFNL